MNYKILLFMLVFFGIFLAHNSSAEVQTLTPVVTGKCVSLPQIYANSSWQNISTIQTPNKTMIVINNAMTNLGGGFFNYTFCQTLENGEYIVNGIGDVDGIATTWNYDFEVNQFGRAFTNSQAILYFLIFVVAVIFFLLFLVLGIYLPSNNQTDEMTGYIIAIENLKYFKMLCLAFAYLTAMLISYFGWMISYGYLNLDFLGTIFRMAFYGTAVALFPGFIIGIFIVISNVVRDKKVGDMLSRGFKVR